MFRSFRASLSFSPFLVHRAHQNIKLNDVMFGGGLGSEGRIMSIDSERPSPTRAPQPQ